MIEINSIRPVAGICCISYRIDPNPDFIERLFAVDGEYPHSLIEREVKHFYLGKKFERLKDAGRLAAENSKLNLDVLFLVFKDNGYFIADTAENYARNGFNGQIMAAYETGQVAENAYREVNDENV